MPMKMGQKLMSAIWKGCGSSRLGWALTGMLVKEIAHAFSCVCSVISACTFALLINAIVNNTSSIDLPSLFFIHSISPLM